MRSDSSKRALVYNRFLSTAGGGERACLDLCVALSALGYTITVVTDPAFKGDLGDIRAIFGISSGADWALERLKDERAIAAFCARGRFDLFVNSTFLSSMPNPAPRGIYLMMFPQFIGAVERSNLRSYTTVLTISEFSRIHLEHRWGEGFPSSVLPPPISSAHTAARPVLEEKERLILLVGRFNVEGHNKCQLDAIRAFRSMRDEGELSPEWRLHLVGNLNPGAATQRYFDRCRRAAEGADITIERNVPFERLQNLYRRAACLWQFTGFGLVDGAEPQNCEHLGLVALDGLAYGTIPFVYERSGVSFLIDHGGNGFVFKDRAELSSEMRLLDRSFKGPTHQAMFRSAIEASSQLGCEAFVARLRVILAEAQTRPQHHAAPSSQPEIEH